MKIATVKVGTPKNYKVMTYINAGLASAIDHWYRCEEARQVNRIVEDLLIETKGMEYFNAVVYIYPYVMESKNEERIKQLILQRYVTKQVKEADLK